MSKRVAGRDVFYDAVQAASVTELATQWEEPAVEAAATIFRSGGLLLLGEIHGVAENPSVIYTLARRFRVSALGLEWDHRLNRVVEQYLDSGWLDIGAVPPSADGRVTPEHFALLAALHREGLLDRLVLFDGYAYDVIGEPDFWNRRDERMAEVLLGSLDPDQPTLVVGGGLHTLVQPIPLTGDAASERWRSLAASMPGVDVLYPMGARLAHSGRTVASGRIAYGSGACNNLGIRPLPPHEKAPTSPRFRLPEDGTFVYDLPMATPAITPDPRPPY